MSQFLETKFPGGRWTLTKDMFIKMDEEQPSNTCKTKKGIKPKTWKLCEPQDTTLKYSA